jgi:hypothetical protein
MYHHAIVCQIISEFGIKKKEEIISVPSKTVYKFKSLEFLRVEGGFVRCIVAETR